MSDLSWCTYCDNAISHYSESLYCSEQCLRADALRNHPLLGYTYPEFVDFPRASPKQQQPSPSLVDTTLSRSTQRGSSASIHTLPTLSTSHSSCQSSPTLSAYDSNGTCPPPPLLLPSAAMTSKSNSIPSLLWTGASTPTTALSRPLMVDYRPAH